MPLKSQTTSYDYLYKNTDAARYVNPIIGTVGEGYTYPGATSPWGMVSGSPHTTYTKKLGYITGKTIAPAGYYYGEPFIEGFGQTHLSGVACPELGAPVLAINKDKFIPDNYKSRYSNEIAKAGYYSVILDDVQTKVQITTTQRAVYYKLIFYGKGPNIVLLDAYNNLSWIKHNGFVKKIDNQTYAGWSQTGNFCNQGNEQKVYFYLQAKTTCDKSGLWKGKSKIYNKQSLNGHVGAWLTYKNANTVDIIIGISYVSIENARKNLEYETGNKSFETVLRENIESWEAVLGRIKILDSNKEKEKEIFYTALYHALLHPNIVSDVNGEYPLYEKDGYGTDTTYQRFGLFSMWDTYRNVHALLSLFYPEQQQDMLYTLEAMTYEAGRAPRWELYSSEINLMVGNPAVSILSEGFIKGFKYKHPDQLFKILYRNATDPNNSWRPGNAEYIKYGYIPEKTKNVWGSVSTTLEYSYDDWALSRFALKLGYDKEASLLVNQSLRWKTLFNHQTNTLCPKDKYGKWIQSFDPAAMNASWLVSLFVKNHGGPGFVEGNAFQYTFMVPHDIEGLIKMFGSVEEFSKNLMAVFHNGYFNLWNEPDMIYPYLLGIDPIRKADMKKKLQRYRSTFFTTKPDGLPGNDDAGTLSSWYVFTALGFYPVNPASGKYAIGIPLFNDINILLPDTDTVFRITANFKVQTEQWKMVEYNDVILDTLTISHDQIMNNGNLNFIINR